MTAHDCVFCRIIDGQAPASIIHEDELAVVFMDIDPVNPGHALVVPRAHATHLADLPEETGAHLFKLAMRTAAAMRKTAGLRCEGVNLFLADGEAAFQEVFHVHLHVFPRFKGDKFKISAKWGQNPPRQALDELAEAIKGHWHTS